MLPRSVENKEHTRLWREVRISFADAKRIVKGVAKIQ
jgi:hypothetical protein